eukprot:gnl/TRDRNA2_/TRDRNA2_173829_c0_seq4.p1 gnl/TRDRNA2_/TRDRNA2_173829_c0~~gnl/TRDRNA2_/TRDRNA2_173829_c0_seq4.p1  ORF type:complete len:316 (+),score=-7.73 gnl/TRDRNA2_/TRDRNA2_173829_c0_seq4:237-1184(+)
MLLVSNKIRLEFDILNLDTAIVNGLRRIIISEVPTMAIEHVFIINNTSVIQDEILAHRLGLVPILADPTNFRFRKQAGVSNEKNTIVFRMAVFYDKTDDYKEKKKVYSAALKWQPNGSEFPSETCCRFNSSQTNTKLCYFMWLSLNYFTLTIKFSYIFIVAIRPVNSKILLAILAPGQEIVLEAHSIKGIGKEHAKWSPVATAWYRFAPEAILLQDVVDDMAEKLSGLLPGFVTTKNNGKNSYAVLGSARENETLLEKFRLMASKEDWAPYLLLRKSKNHFIFTIETSGSLSGWEILSQSIKILINKIDSIIHCL